MPTPGAMWRSNYDMTPQEFSAMYDRLWAETSRSTTSCTATRGPSSTRSMAMRFSPRPDRSAPNLLGNMWAQEWGNIYDVVAPKGAGDIGYSLDDLLVKKKINPTEMVKIGERFYTSLGLAPLPETFWQRSQIVRPEGREVVCHASAWDIDNKDDLRIKMCTKVNGDDFVTIHHELGHNYYQRAYNQQPYLYLNGANDGFHEAIGDFVALSITPDYLVSIDLARQGQGAERGQGHRAVAVARRWTRWRSCRSACWSTNGAGACSTARSRRPVTTRPGST